MESERERERERARTPRGFTEMMPLLGINSSSSSSSTASFGCRLLA